MFYKNITFQEKNEYVFEASLANAMRLKLFSFHDYERLLDSEIEQVINLLGEKKYDISVKNSQEILFKEEHNLMKQILKLVKDQELKEYFSLPFDFFNLKYLYKGKMKEENFEGLKLSSYGVLDKEKLKKLYQGEEIGDLPPVLAQAMKNFNQDLSSKSPFESDLLWDKYLHQFYLDQSQKLKSDYLFKIHSLKIDLLNILNLFRIKSFDKEYKVYEKTFIKGGQLELYVLSDLYKEDSDVIAAKLDYLDYAEKIKKGLEGYKKTGSYSDLEKELEEYFLYYLSQGANRFFGYEGIIAYYWLKANELSNLHLLLTAKENSIQKEWILQRIRV